ncbi:hypothetical protein [Streptomyces alboflavus]|uniref:hypothetical protein n=1 Tax=Streptomyces alboflavus TaxID=67267 RepID=UPI000C1E29F6|nr:hypothetical protein [Streptomyces alboflavus]
MNAQPNASGADRSGHGDWSARDEQGARGADRESWACADPQGGTGATGEAHGVSGERAADAKVQAGEVRAGVEAWAEGTRARG